MEDRAAKGGGTTTDIAPSFIQKAIQGVRLFIEGVTPSTFFGPQQPIAPQAQQVQGRQFDYPAGININIQPRTQEGVSFPQLRALADNYDILRIVIETRKDTLCRMKWKYQAKDATKGKGDDPRIKKLEEFFAYPDKEHDWSTWYRMILEDLLVIDAPTLFVRKTRGGITGPAQPYALEIIDGATITRKINADGRTPEPPSIAYQQILKGVPAVDYTRDELLYLPRNPRPNKLYGLSPVEQILMTVNIGLRRQLHQLEFYTEGNVPDLLMGVPESWNPDQIKQYQLFFDTLTDTAQRRKGRFIPGGVKPYDTKEKELKDAFDEWLARIVCFAFSIPVQPFIKEMNRSTAESAAQTAKEEGLEPVLSWTKGLKDRVITQHFGWTDIEAIWELEKQLDPDIKSQIDDRDLRNGTATINEVRKARGAKPVEGGDIPMVFTASGPMLLKDIIDPPEPPPVAAPAVPAVIDPSKKVEKQEVAPAVEKPAEDAERIERVKKKVLSRSTGTARLY